MPLPELVQRSQKIVRGVVSAVESRTAPDGSIWTRYTLDRARAVKGRIAPNGTFQFRCRGGSTEQGTEHVPGAPRFEVGEDIVVFFAAENRTCQVMGWYQGAFRVQPAPDGRAVVVDGEGRLIMGVSAGDFVRGARPSWARVPEQDDALIVDTAAAGRSASAFAAEATTATADDVLQELGTLTRTLRNLAPADRAADGAAEFFPPSATETAVAPRTQAEVTP